MRLFKGEMAINTNDKEVTWSKQQMIRLKAAPLLFQIDSTKHFQKYYLWKLPQFDSIKCKKKVNTKLKLEKQWMQSHIIFVIYTNNRKRMIIKEQAHLYLNPLVWSHF